MINMYTYVCMSTSVKTHMIIYVRHVCIQISLTRLLHRQTLKIPSLRVLLEDKKYTKFRPRDRTIMHHNCLYKLLQSVFHQGAPTPPKQNYPSFSTFESNKTRKKCPLIQSYSVTPQSCHTEWLQEGAQHLGPSPFSLWIRASALHSPWESLCPRFGR